MERPNPLHSSSVLREIHNEQSEFAVANNNNPMNTYISASENEDDEPLGDEEEEAQEYGELRENQTHLPSQHLTSKQIHQPPSLPNNLLPGSGSELGSRQPTRRRKAAAHFQEEEEEHDSILKQEAFSGKSKNRKHVP